MSIDSKHAYRFEYLKSDKWKAVRLDALVREKAKCQICLHESISNDAHHVWYPENVWDTTERHLVVLCRGCHEFLHIMLPECKTRDEDEGIEMWVKFKNAIRAWRIDKVGIFASTEGITETFAKTKGLRDAYDLLKKQRASQEAVLNAYRQQFGIISVDLEAPAVVIKDPSIDDLCKDLFATISGIKKWAKDNKPEHSVDNSDFMI